MLRYKVTLTAVEATQLEKILSKGKHSSLQFRNACILLNVDEAKGDRKLSNEQIAGGLHVTAKTVDRIKQRFVEAGVEACLERRAYPEAKELKADGDFEAHWIALSCSTAPQG